MKTIYVKQYYKKRNTNKYFFKYDTNFNIIKCELLGTYKKPITFDEDSIASAYTEYLVKYPNGTMGIETKIYK